MAPRKCYKSDCSKLAHAQGLCNRCYKRGKKDGSVLTHLRSEPLETRFWRSMSTYGPTLRPELGPCWIWMGTCSEKGYGRISAGIPGIRKDLYSHIVSWDIHFPDKPRNGLWVLHHCDNPPCGRPEHLFLGDAAANNADKVAKGRNVSPRGEKSGQARLTVDQVRDIRRNYTGARGELTRFARQYGVSVNAISLIIKRKNWSHI